MFFPGVGTAFAVGLKAMQVGFDTIPLFLDLLDWLNKNSAKVVHALKCMQLPNHGGHAICQYIRDYWIGHKVGRRDNLIKIVNQLHENLTVYVECSREHFRFSRFKHRSNTGTRTVSMTSGRVLVWHTGKKPFRRMKIHSWLLVNVNRTQHKLWMLSYNGFM